jgi:cyclase
MLKKRLIGVVTVKNGWAVQSFGYRRYLPLGRPEVLVQNLDRWGADEILLQCIDRSAAGLGPDLDVLGKVSGLGIATPLIYSGGISRREDALKVISQGADRIMVDALLLDSPQLLEAIARDLGSQAVIANLPARFDVKGLQSLDYRSLMERPLISYLKQLPLQWVSELMVTDWQNEGCVAGFDERLLRVTDCVEKPIIFFGGIYLPQQVRSLISHPKVVGIGMGNFLSYREHEVQRIKREIGSLYIRKFSYERSIY